MGGWEKFQNKKKKLGGGQKENKVAKKKLRSSLRKGWKRANKKNELGMAHG